MNETPKAKSARRIPRTLLIWLASFILIALATGIALLPTDGTPKKSPDILWSLFFGVLGASILVCLLVFIRWLGCWHNLRRALVGLAILATLAAIFYTEEDWRGKRAWDNCKRELEAKGEVLDWNAYIPPPVPDDQNFFKAPHMTEWFVKHTNATAPNELYEKLSRFPTNNPVVLAEWTWQPLLTAKNIAAANSENADLVLKYSSTLSRPHIFTEANVPVVSDENPDTNAPIAVIQFHDVPLTTAIKNLARQAGINYLLDPNIGYNQPGKNGQIKSEPSLSVRWKIITARAALLALLDNFDLQLIENPNAGLARITLKNSDTPQIYASPALNGEIKQLLQNVVGTNIIGARGDRLLAKSPAEIKPTRIILESGQKPDPEIIAWFTQCFPTNVTGGGSPRIHIEPPIGTIPVPNTFRVILDHASSAADYLAWSDQAVPDFDLIREALKRPYARMDGDYSIPAESPIPNFLAVRSMAQVLAERAQCHFLLNQPEQALDDLTRIHDMCHLLEAAPTGKPMFLVSSMINVAVSGLYVDTIAYSFQKNAWQEPQFAALQKQLAEINLTPLVFESLKEGPAFACRDAEILPLPKMASYGRFDAETWQDKVFDRLYDWLWPRGWTYQNMVNVVQVDQNWLAGFDLAHETISPHTMDSALQNVSNFLDRKSPFRILATIAVPNFVKAEQVTAYNQTMVNEAQIACALERYHLAYGDYPETLDTLAPQFMEKIPHDIIGGQPLHYHRTDDGKFLLYSVGWNETDDGGLDVSTQNKNGVTDFTKGDWVWKN